MQECVEQAFPEDDYGSSYHKMRKAVCSKDLNTSLRDVSFDQFGEIHSISSVKFFPLIVCYVHSRG